VSNFIAKAVKHPGRLTRAAARAGISKHEQAERWAHSDDPSKRGAGNLGLRFMSGDLHRANVKKRRSIPSAGGRRKS